MTEKLCETAKRFEEIERRLSDAATGDIEEYKRLMKERKELLPFYEEYSFYKKAENDFLEAKK